MPNSFKLSNKAVDDLSAIWKYTCYTWSETQADKYYYMILDTCQEIADQKSTAKQYPEIHPEIFGAKAGQHLLFFRRIKTDRIEIIRILHNRMDLKNRIQN
jgi:toxin ParE1/3/4